MVVVRLDKVLELLRPVVVVLVLKLVELLELSRRVPVSQNVRVQVDLSENFLSSIEGASSTVGAFAFSLFLPGITARHNCT
eukprot:3684983-Rhodomonas_salina.1